MQRRRPTDEKEKEKDTLSIEERQKKLERLRLLKAKLASLEEEKEETVSTNQTETWTPPQSTQEVQKQSTAEEEKDAYLDDIDLELQRLEQEAIKEMQNISLEPDTAVIDSAIDKISGQEVKLSPAELKEIDAELAKLENEIDYEEKKAAVIVSIFDKLCEEHEWLNQPQYGFMFSMPNKKKNKKDYISWLDDWNRVLFDYARIASKHIVYSKKLLSEKPWSDLTDRTNAILEISDSLIKNKTAEWLDKKKEKLRIYWRSLEAWADSIVEWAHDNVYTEPLFIVDIRETKEPFHNLPDEDLIKIFNIIEKDGKGTTAKLKNGDLAISIKF